jgi:hypothetical protein
VIPSSEDALDQAERDFADGAFSPFWDSVEQAMLKLGIVDNCVVELTAQSKRHSELTKSYKARPPLFPVDLNAVQKIGATHTTFDRIPELVRMAQCNFQFATIYEQRKTNQLLVAGFVNLGQALNGMGQRISSSIDGLSNQISEMSLTLNESVTRFREESLQSGQQLIESVEELNSTMQKEASNRTEQYERALTMLDNIQRRRIPYPRKLGDGAH